MRPALRRAIRRWFWLTVGGFVLFVVLSNRWVINSSDAYLYREASLLPENEIGLVLGTSPYREDGSASTHFHGRIRAAAELYRQGKIRRIVVSGANPDATYNEPKRMSQELVKAGVPLNAITMDFAGFRTLDSVTRAQTVWGYTRFTVITQRYHCYRAIFLGKKLGLDVVGYAAPLGDSSDLGPRHPVREVFARGKAVLDLILLKIWPSSLGLAEKIRVAPGAETT